MDNHDSVMFYLSYNNLKKYVTVNNDGELIKLIDVLQAGATFFNIDISKYKLYLCDGRNVELNQDTFQIILRDSQRTYDQLFILRVTENNEHYHCVSTQTEETRIANVYAAPIEKSDCFVGSIPKKLKLEVIVLQAELQKYLEDHVEGKRILEIYNKTQALPKSLRTKLINILVGHLVQIHGTYPSSENKILWAKATALIFPMLCENHDPANFGIFYNAANRGGFFAFRLRTINRSLNNNSRLSSQVEEVHITEENQEVNIGYLEDLVVKLRQLCPKNDQHEIFDLMKQTMCLRIKPFTFETYPRYLDTPGLISFEFDIKYPTKSEDFIKKWPEIKSKILEIGYERNINIYDEFATDDEKYESDITAFLILSKLLKTVGRRKVATAQSNVTTTLIAFRKTGTTFTVNDGSYKHPILLATGTTKKCIDSYCILIDEHEIPLKKHSGVEVFLNFFKSFYIFCCLYPPIFYSFFHFIQEAFLKLNSKKLTPRLIELKNRLNC